MTDSDEHKTISLKRPATLKPNALRRADLERGSYIAIVPSSTTFDDVMTPAFWANHVATLSGGQFPRPFARVEVVREDGTMDLDLRVIQTKPGMVLMRCLRRYEAGVADVAKGKKAAPSGELTKADLPTGYKWAHTPNGDRPGHLIRLESTGEILVAGLPTMHEAVLAAINHAKVATAPAV